MSFCTTINCIDGRSQLPVITYLKERFSVLYVDSITEPGPVAILSDPEDSEKRKSILERVSISIDAHQSTGISIVAHHDCAGNPKSEKVQLEQLRESFEFLRKCYPDMEIVGLFVDEEWAVREVYASRGA